MGINKNWGTKEMRFDLLKWEHLMLSRRLRTRVECDCWSCGTKIPKSSFAYGDTYTRVCVKCWENVMTKCVKDGVARILEIIQIAEQDLETNRKKIDQINMLANLQ